MPLLQRLGVHCGARLEAVEEGGVTNDHSWGNLFRYRYVLEEREDDPCCEDVCNRVRQFLQSLNGLDRLILSGGPDSSRGEHFRNYGSQRISILVSGDDQFGGQHDDQGNILPSPAEVILGHELGHTQAYLSGNEWNMAAIPIENMFREMFDCFAAESDSSAQELFDQIGNTGSIIEPISLLPLGQRAQSDGEHDVAKSGRAGDD